MHSTKRWNILPADPAAEELAERLRTSPLLAQVLLNRGLRDPEDCRSFLRPSLRELHEPAAIPNLTAAAQRIAQAIRDKQRIFIYGDYDVDGITATTILWHAIHILGGSAEFYIPHRVEEGYGLNSEAITQICDQGAQLIVTVDCGVTAIEPCRIAKERGVDVIVTDHHLWHQSSAEGASAGPALPDCLAVVHPRLPQETPYPNPHLCGAGIAFKLAWGVGQMISGKARVSDEFRDFLVEATALAALGTIADVVPLRGENRILAQYGLTGLEKTKLRGLRALIDSAGLNGQNIDSYHVGFLLAPRLNACGRMGHARLAVELLTKASDEQAKQIADYLEQQNRQRQAVERKILAGALEQIAQQGFDSQDCPAIVLSADDWHVGVIGIVASRIVDRLHRPAILISTTNGQGQGSGRSIPGFHLANALDACKDILDSYGGHEMAAGVRVATSRINEFREAFCRHAQSVITPEMRIPELTLETAAELRQINHALVKDMQRLGPFGHGNRRPLLACQGLELAGPPRRVGKTGDHLQLYVRQGSSSMKCIAFGYGAMFDQLQAGMTIDLAVEPSLNEYQGRVSVELDVKDLHIV